jgi:hypothetical protein
MECTEYGFAILHQISYHYICHLSEGEGKIFQQQKCYYINENKERAISRLCTNYIQ